MFKCDKCNRELKSKAGLVRHTKSCKVEVDDSKVEVIMNLKNRIMCCRDAETRYYLGVELNAIEKSDV